MQRHDKSGVTGFATCIALRRSALMVAVAVSLCAVTSASAQRVTVRSTEDPVQPGQFFLAFEGFGAPSSGAIISTDYAIEVDAARGSAKLVNYLQHVEPLILPGGFDTGEITVMLVEGSSRGTYDSRTGEFETSEDYAVFFEGDLSAFNLVSPVIMPSDSIGFVELNGVDGGRVDLDWAGSGELDNPIDPTGPPLTFSYSCAVNTVFDSRAEYLLHLRLSPRVMALNVEDAFVEDLMAELGAAGLAIDAGNANLAMSELQDFRDLLRSPGWVYLSLDEAASLGADAGEVVSLLRLPALPTRKGAPDGRTIR